jgi:hypothetical protein
MAIATVTSLCIICVELPLLPVLLVGVPIGAVLLFAYVWSIYRLAKLPNVKGPSSESEISEEENVGSNDPADSMADSEEISGEWEKITAAGPRPSGSIHGADGCADAPLPDSVPSEQEIMVSSIQSRTTSRDLRILICEFVRAHRNNSIVCERQIEPQLESELRVLLNANLQMNEFSIPQSIAKEVSQDAKIDAFVDALKNNADAIDSKCEACFASAIRKSILPDDSNLLGSIPNKLLGDYFICDRFSPVPPPPMPPQSHMQNIYERVNDFINDSGEVNADEIGHTMLVLANDIKNEEDSNLRLEKMTLLGRLKSLHRNHDLQTQLYLIKVPIPKTISNLASFRKAATETGRSPTDAELRRIALQAWIYPVRQGSVGSCFATAPLINLQMNNPDRMLMLITEIFAKGSMERQTMGHAKVEIAVNRHEQPHRNQPLFKSLQYAMVRTVADASHLMGYRDLDPSSFAGRSSVEELNKAMAKVNAHLRATGGNHSPLPMVTWTPPTYDSNTQIYAGKGGWNNGLNGSWIAHYGIGGDSSIPMADFSEFEVITRLLNSCRNSCDQKTQKHIAEAIGHITKIEQMYGGTDVSACKRIYVEGGGWIKGPMKAIGGHAPIFSNVTKNCTSADEVFLHWFPVMVNAAKKKLTRALVCSTKHVFNLVLDMSKVLMDNLTSSDLSTILNHIKEGNEILFIDPNWNGWRGIGIRYSADANKYILFGQGNSGAKMDIDPSDKNWESFFKDLFSFK